MELTYDYVKDDPCYGCKYAVQKTEKEIENEGIFTRRFMCANLSRRDFMELEIIRAIAARDYTRAQNVLSVLWDSQRCGNGLLKVVEDSIPMCYQKKV